MLFGKGAGRRQPANRPSGRGEMRCEAGRHLPLVAHTTMASVAPKEGPKSDSVLAEFTLEWVFSLSLLITLMHEVRVPMENRPTLQRHGDAVFKLPKGLMEKNDEVALVARLICDRRLFGECYRGLVPAHFHDMGANSGVMVAGSVPSAEVLKDMTFPGDIDLLVIPYDGDQLIASEALAIEFKAVRASFRKQGKSPNEFGFSQAKSLLKNGFPYVAVGHLVVSDDGPIDSWRRVLVTEVLDSAGRVNPPRDVLTDMLPGDLLSRSFGRLEKASDNSLLGLLAAYMTDRGMWYPLSRAAAKNPQVSSDTCHAIASCFLRHHGKFVDIPKY